MKFARKIRKAITDRGITRAEAARIIGCSQRALYFWIDGTWTPKPAMQEGVLKRLAQPNGK